jgi:hypothetical protein
MKIVTTLRRFQPLLSRSGINQTANAACLVTNRFMSGEWTCHGFKIDIKGRFLLIAP